MAKLKALDPKGQMASVALEKAGLAWSTDESDGGNGNQVKVVQKAKKAKKEEGGKIQFQSEDEAPKERKKA